MKATWKPNVAVIILQKHSGERNVAVNLLYSSKHGTAYQSFYSNTNGK